MTAGGPGGPAGTVLLGTDLLTGSEIEVDVGAFASTHTHIMGRSGYGKTSLLKRITRDLLRAGCGLLVLDGKNELADDVIDTAAYYKLGDRSIVLDPKLEWVVGMNYLEPLGRTEPDELAELTIEALKKFFHEESTYKAWLEEWGPSALLPLIDAKLTLLELFAFTSPVDDAFRRAILARLEDPFFRRKWEELRAFRPPDQAQMLNVVRTRATKFWTNSFLKAVFGQGRTTVDWLRVMDEGGVVVARLGEGEGLTRGAASFMGAAILHQIKTIAPARGINPERPFFVVADEFQKFATPDFADGVERLRGFGVHFLLSHQLLGHLRTDESALLDSIVTNSANKIYFSISAKDAVEIGEELYAGWIHGDEVKEEISQTKFRPVESRRLIVTYGEGRGHGVSRMSADTRARGHADLAGAATAAGRVESALPDQPAILDTSSVASHQASMDSDASAHTDATVVNEAVQRSVSTTWAPWLEHEEFREVSGRTFRSVEELRERYKGFLVRQDPRRFQWKLHQAFPRALEAPTVRPVNVSLLDKQEFWDTMLHRHVGPGIPLYMKKDDVLRAVDRRVEVYLDALPKGAEDPDADADVWFKEPRPAAAGEPKKTKKK